MESNVITIEKQWISQQTDNEGKPLVELKKGDIVELKADGIYFKRKIDVGQETYNYKSMFEQFKRHSL